MMIDERVLVGDHYALCHVVALGLYAALFCTAATTAAAKVGARVQWTTQVTKTSHIVHVTLVGNGIHIQI